LLLLLLLLYLLLLLLYLLLLLCRSHVDLRISGIHITSSLVVVALDPFVITLQ
jgi:hypothetical protein